jgi:hypothetical protein
MWPPRQTSRSGRRSGWVRSQRRQDACVMETPKEGMLPAPINVIDNAAAYVPVVNATTIRPKANAPVALTWTPGCTKDIAKGRET